jgi:hypothetical protein
MKIIGDVITMSDVVSVVKSVNAVKNFILTHVKACPKTGKRV